MTEKKKNNRRKHEQENKETGGAPVDGAALEIDLPVDTIENDDVLELCLVSNRPGGDLGLGSREGYLEPRLFIE